MSGFSIKEPDGTVYDVAAQQAKKKSKASRRFAKEKALLTRLEGEIVDVNCQIESAYAQFHTKSISWDQCMLAINGLDARRDEAHRKRIAQKSLIAQLQVANPQLGEGVVCEYDAHYDRMSVPKGGPVGAD